LTDSRTRDGRLTVALARPRGQRVLLLRTVSVWRIVSVYQHCGRTVKDGGLSRVKLLAPQPLV
jgi:hypothetical protein